MEVDAHQTSAPSQTENFDSRPKFVNEKELRQRFPCAICQQVLLKPHQTSPCGIRVCKSCVDDLFNGKELLKPCPLSHDDLEEDEIEECQRLGLRRKNITPDHSVANSLRSERCYCKNHEYGCNAKPMWKKLKDHERDCQYKPSLCPNNGCKEKLAAVNMNRHLESCPFTLTSCPYCKEKFPKVQLEAHFNDCDSAETQCKGCGKSFNRRKQLITHQRISPDCLTSAGKCFYYDYCSFFTESLEEMRHHLRTNQSAHLEALTLTVNDIGQSFTKKGDMSEPELKKAINKRVKPLERVTADLSMKLIKFGNQLASSETNGESLVNAMRTVNTSSQDVESVKTRVAQIERQIKESGLDRVTVIESHSQSIRRNNELLNEMEKRLRNLEMTSYDGTIIWKIKDYKKKKSDAVRGRQMSIYSNPFYTSRTGYRLCLRAYLNGDGLGRGKSLSLFFVVMRGEYDELLQFPFKQRVTFSLLCPSNPSLSKHESFVPDPDSSSFRRPQTEMNIASGCPQFVPQSEVESSLYLANDAIYICAKVEPGGDYKLP